MGSMRVKLVLLAAVVVAAAGGAAAYVVRARSAPTHPRPASSGPSEHAQGMDEAMGAVLVPYDAPDGGTPCETAYLAFKASQDYAADHPVKQVITWLAPRQDFLDKCATLAPTTQLCLGPRYLVRHRDECDKAKPPPDVAAAMMKMATLSGPPSH